MLLNYRHKLCTCTHQMSARAREEGTFLVFSSSGFSLLKSFLFYLCLVLCILLRGAYLITLLHESELVFLFVFIYNTLNCFLYTKGALEIKLI